MDYILLRPGISVKEDLVTSSTENCAKDLVMRLIEADLLVTDLDHVDTMNSPAIRMAVRFYGVTPVNSPQFLAWATSSIRKLLCAYASRDPANVERAMEEQSLVYQKICLRDPSKNGSGSKDTFKQEVLDRLGQGILSREEIVRSLFPGVQGFYDKLPASKFYLSRNVFPVVDAYARYLQFDGAMWDVRGKGEALQQLLDRELLDFRRMIIKGDGEPELELIDCAKSNQDTGRLDDVLSIQRVKNRDLVKPDKTGGKFDVKVGPSDFVLLEILKEYGPAGIFK